jgi:N6-L-threonylcarbamoyladenine synthase
MTNILGIETSCDETAAAVVQDGRYILSNVVSSSLKEHKKYGGIIPEIASRRQMELIHTVVDEALEGAGLTLRDIDAIAVTMSPGLIGSLLVGISFARALAFATGKPLVEVNHIQAHLYANFLTPLDEKPKPPRLPRLPAVGLVVSGGHSSIFHVRSFRNFRILGQTRDDAAGEAFDKVARILKLGYPGGPVIDRLAKQGRNNEIRFRCADLPETNDFSFSGIKTAVLYYTRKHDEQNMPTAKIAYAFQDSVVSVLVDKCMAVCKKAKVKTLLLGGGVAANSALRTTLTNRAEEYDLDVFFPPVKLCIDNAAMIAGLGYHR